MATTIGELTWKISADTKNIDNSMKKTETGMAKFGKVAKAAFSAAIVAAFAKAAINLGKKLVGLASDAEETANKFNVVFDGISSASEAAENLAENYGLSSTASQMLLADTADLLQGFGVTKDESLKLSEATQKLAADLASFANKDPIEASKALTSALLGEREAVKSLGIAITDAELKRFATEQGQVYEAMTKAEKAVLTLELAYKQSANAIGDFERSQDSFANQLKIAKANSADLGAELGERLLPISTNVVEGFAKLAGRLADTVKHGNDLRDVMEGLAGGGIADTAAAQKTLQAELDDVYDSLVRQQDTWGKYREENEKIVDETYRLAKAQGVAITESDELWYSYDQLTMAIQDLEFQENRALTVEELMAISLENSTKLLIENAEAARDKAAADLIAANAARLLGEQEAEAQGEAAAERRAFLNKQRLSATESELAANMDAVQAEISATREKFRLEEELEAEMAEIRRAATEERLADASAYAGNIGTIFNNLIQVQLAGDEELTTKKKKNIIALYRIQQAANIAQIAIDTAAAIVKAWVSPGFPFAIPLTAIIAGIGITSAAVVAATPPPVALQSGGIVPARPGGTNAVIGEAGQAEAVIPLDDDNGFGSVRVMVNLDGQVLADFTQKALNNRDIIVDAGSVS